ncbi:putative ARAC-type regulatory protein [Enterobacter hormaechei]|nr:AraC family transcriptional regulator [Enterobacter hormaechei]MDO2399725.1 AraC family transcriptional regulator [Enterobacter hormaechei]MDO2419222.1 AraC family transcriptional regulator [Enterobacter hormaechei]CZX04749.1 putative ARAC-type regulatory protein [Enterobacter hormaechei]
MISDKSVEKLIGLLSRDITRRIPGTGDLPTAVDGLELFRRNEPAPPVSCLVPPSIVLVAEGAKIMWVGGEPYEYNAEKFLITSLDLPASSEVLQATASRPCVGVSYKLDQRVLMELIAQGCLPPVKKRDAGTGVGIGTMTDVLLEPFCRLLSLLDEPEAIPVLGPLIQREIHYRLLMSDQSQTDCSSRRPWLPYRESYRLVKNQYSIIFACRGAGSSRANEYALFPPTLQAARGNESAPVSEMAAPQ